MQQNDSITLLRSTVDRVAELKSKGQNQSDLMITEVLVPMLSALGWQKKNGLLTSQLHGYVEVQPKPAGILGMVGETPQFLFGPISNSLPFAGTEEAAELMSYSYNKDTPWLILSDLSLITVFNVLESVKVSPARRSPRFSIRFDDLLVNINELKNWLGFEAVKEGNLAELDQKIRRSRGVALPVTDKLFEQMRRWRMELIEEITIRSSLTPNEADILGNRLLNRLLFMRVCEDRGFGEHPRLESITDDSALSQGNRQLLEQVRSSFRKYHERYNTELFKLSEVDSFSFPEDTLATIIKGLHSPGFPSVKYDFSVIDADILGAMYEQYVRLRAAWQAPATISSDSVQQSFLPTPRTTLVTRGKSVGIYYTPKYIVEHIVQQTVGYWFKNTPASIETAPSVMDMSCGSGSFLLAAYQHIVDHLLGKNSLTIEEKHRLLTRCIFGVDRDPRAVEIARLNLWLIGLNSRVSLPDLSTNILVGNSLLDPAMQGDSAMLHLFFGTDWQQRKPILWKDAFPEQMAAGGFDIIVGNPPYVRIQNMEDQLEKRFYAEYFGAATGSFDLSVAFVEMALKLLRPGGVVGLIVSNALLRSNYAEHLRKRLMQEGVLRHVVDFTDQLVFRGVGAYTCLIFLEKPGPSSPKATSIFRLRSIPELQLYRSEENEVYDKQMVSGRVDNKRLGGGPWVLVPDREQRLREKLAEGRPRLWELVRIFQGIKTGRDKAFVLNVTRSIPEQGLVMAHSELTNKEHPFELALMKPLIKGGHMRRFHLVPSNLMILLPYKETQLITEDTLREEYEHAWKYLDQVKANLSSRPTKVTKDGWGSNWYAFSRPQNLSLFPRPKLVTPDIAAEASFAYDEDGGLYFSGGVAGGYGLAVISDKVTPQFLTGLLNSSLLDWYFQPGAARFREGYFLYESRFLRNQPIETYYDEKGSPKGIAVDLVSIVRQVVEAKKNLYVVESDSVSLARMVDHIQNLEKHLDELVFALYGLTQDEIKLVREGPWYKG